MNRLRTALRRALHVFTRSERRPGASRRRMILPWRGYGTRDTLYLMGRVFRQPGSGSIAPRGQLAEDLLNLLRRALRWGLGGVSVVARCGDDSTTVTTDRDGYFELTLNLKQPVEPAGLWHGISLALEDDPGIHAPAEVLVPPRDARYVVISDIDDTVVHTGVARKLDMLRNLFLSGAQSRVAFPGVAAFYRALHGDGRNPMLYVSRAPWSIYEMLETFFQVNGIPVGPVLFLRDWGLTLQHPLPRRAREHKHELIERMLSIYTDQPFVLIGDSGQHDPEIYADIVRRHRGRVRAVYIRDVGATGKRVEEIEALARETTAADTPLMLAADSLAMVEHAVEHGLVDANAIEAVKEEMARAGARPAGPAHTADADDVAEELEETENVAVERTGSRPEKKTTAPLAEHAEIAEDKQSRIHRQPDSGRYRYRP